jgi:hypothetical protein
VIERKITEHVMEFNCLGNKISEYKKDLEYKLQSCNRINGLMKRNSGKQMCIQTNMLITTTTVITAATTSGGATALMGASRR